MTSDFHKRANYYILSCAIVFLITIICGVFLLMAAEPDVNTAQKAVESFLKQSAKGEINRVEVYYMGWNILTGIAITEDFLRDNHYDYKVIAVRPNLSDVEKSLRKFKFKTVGLWSFDIRLGYVFYTSDQEVLRLFFANSAPVVTVNGVPFKVTPELIMSLLPFLPFEAYQEISEGMLVHWAFSWPVSSQQESSSADQKELNEP